jgi:hypothetical protein
MALSPTRATGNLCASCADPNEPLTMSRGPKLVRFGSTTVGAGADPTPCRIGGSLLACVTPSFLCSDAADIEGLALGVQMQIYTPLPPPGPNASMLGLVAQTVSARDLYNKNGTTNRPQFKRLSHTSIFIGLSHIAKSDRVRSLTSSDPFSSARSTSPYHPSWNPRNQGPNRTQASRRRMKTAVRSPSS